ncbi:uncharacterized protein EI97DRAFT_436217 [Westerdykella ornata]|uniref:Uncharacterized protein n=1 Tax=Westerdykella ornata TaxID=318751 RepID=A0A6A6JAS1_WESOR|nr:uncharacterized protein EI97DRAFT_436217 [Westerdykella ornata]KAF2273357.1 hypothetical protein EI97DRAFT_436217 [Westerdykella ornata]
MHPPPTLLLHPSCACATSQSATPPTVPLNNSFQQAQADTIQPSCPSPFQQHPKIAIPRSKAG